MDRLAVITTESVWLVELNGAEAYVTARASFGQHMPTDHEYAGYTLSGAAALKVGNRLVFKCQCGQGHTGWGDGTVSSGVIQRIVNWTDKEPEPEQPGFIRLDPSWSFLLPFVEGNFEVRAQARKALGLADDLVELVAMGRVTSDDLAAARARRRA